MGEKDITEHTLLDINSVFADIYNVLCGGGKTIIKPDELESAEGKSQYKFFGNAREQERDIVKRWNGADIQMAFIGFENQTKPDPLMPLRIISYDGASYRSQIPTQKEMNKGAVVHPVPVITIVLYLGYETRWNTNRSLHECFTIPDELVHCFHDYEITVMEIAWLDREVIDSFQSDFWFLADYLWQMRVNGEYIPNSDRAIEHVSEVLNLFHAVTGNDFFASDEITSFSAKKEVRMSDYFTQLTDNARNEGILKGKIEGKLEGKIEGIADSIISTSNSFHLVLDEVIAGQRLDAEKEAAVREEIRRRGYNC